MVGRELSEQYPKRDAKIGDIVFESRNVCAGGFLKDITLQVRAGEILGVAGLVGAGRTEFARVVFGADPLERGELYREGRRLRIRSPQDAIRNGIALLTEDRKQQGLLLNMTIEQNITFVTVKDISRGAVIDRKKEKDIVEDYGGKLRIKTPSMKQLVKNLSGGNQQKVALAKWMAANARLMIFDEPTRGIDVGAKQEIYQLMNELAEGGMAIIMISSEMPELLGVSDRIVVMGEGRIKGSLEMEEATQQAILRIASDQKGV
jgi:ribose transport system ATP-binding protein